MNFHAKSKPELIKELEQAQDANTIRVRQYDRADQRLRRVQRAEDSQRENAHSKFLEARELVPQLQRTEIDRDAERILARPKTHKWYHPKRLGPAIDAVASGLFNSLKAGVRTLPSARIAVGLLLVSHIIGAIPALAVIRPLLIVPGTAIPTFLSLSIASRTGDRAKKENSDSLSVRQLRARVYATEVGTIALEHHLKVTQNTCRNAERTLTALRVHSYKCQAVIDKALATSERASGELLSDVLNRATAPEIEATPERATGLGRSEMSSRTAAPELGRGLER